MQKIICSFTYLHCSWPNLKESNIICVLFCTLQMVDCLPTFVRNFYLLLCPISHPTMATFNLRWPLSFAFLPFCTYRHSYHSISNYYDQLIEIIMQVIRSEPDKNRNLHTRGNIPRVFFGVLHVRDDELLFLQRSDFYSLNMLRTVYKPDFTLICFPNIKICKQEFFWLYSKNASCSCIFHCFGVLHCFAQMSLVFCKCNFSIHSFNDLIVIDLLLDG